MSRITKIAVSLELIWPLPLVAIGILGIHSPLPVGAAAVLALVPWCARLLIFGRPTRRSFLGGALGLFVVSALVGMWATYDARLSWPALLTLLGSAGLFFAIVNSTGSPRQIAGGLVGAGVLVALYFVGQYAHFDYPEGMGGFLSRLGRVTGSLLPDLAFLTPPPNAVAGFLEGVLLLGLALGWQERGGRRLAWGLAALAVAYGLLISGSRGSWIGLVVAGGIGGLLVVPNRPLRLALGGLGVAGIVLGACAVTRLAPIGQPLLASVLGTASSRIVLYRNSYHLLGDYLFTGIGPGETFAMVYSRYQLLIPVPFLSYPHNLLLSVGLGYGLLGLAALAWLLAALYRFVARVERAGLGRRSLPLFRAAWLGATATFVHGLIDSPQFSDSRWTMPMVFGLLGLAVATGRAALAGAVAEDARGTRSQGRRHWRWAAAAVMVVALAVAAGSFWRPLVGMWYANLGAVHQTWADLSPGLDDAARDVCATRAVAYYERALDVNPSQPVANRRLGMMAAEHRDFEAAVAYLQRAYPQEPRNQATLKALGLAYLWTGRLGAAEELLWQLDVQSELIEELNVWVWWWSTQGREDLSAYAGEMVRRLSARR